MDMIELKDANILLLDDDEENLQQTKNELQGKGLHASISMEPGEAINMAVNNKINILICDYRLENISKQLGNEILLSIRSKNKHIFLVLFSAYTAELSGQERRKMENNHIQIYGKNDITAFLLNMVDDFRNFQMSVQKTVTNLTPTKQRSANIPDNDMITETAAIETASILKGISNQSFMMPVKGYPAMAVSQIAVEVETLTDIGRVFLNDWIKSTHKYKK